MKEVTLHCPKCGRRTKAKAERSDPPGTATVDIQCPECNHGDFDSPAYFDVAGKEISGDLTRDGLRADLNIADAGVYVLASDYDALKDDRDWEHATRKQLEDTCDALAAENAVLKGIIARDKSSAVHRLHNICDHLAEQREESPFTREAWDQQDAEIARVNRENVKLREALGKIEAAASGDDNASDDDMHCLEHIESLAADALRPTVQPSGE